MSFNNANCILVARSYDASASHRGRKTEDLLANAQKSVFENSDAIETTSYCMLI